MSKMNLSNKEQIVRAINSVARRASSLQSDIQKIGLACMQHTIDHGDYSLSVRLIESVSKANGLRKTALIKWFEAFMGASFDQKNGKFQYDDGRDAATIMIEQAKAVNWFDFKAPPATAPLDVNKAIQKILNKVQDDDTPVSFDLDEVVKQISDLRSALESLVAEAEAEAA